MKMRKILSAVVASAVAASAMMVSASAASVSANIFSSGSYKVMPFEGTSNFSELRIPNGAILSITPNIRWIEPGGKDIVIDDTTGVITYKGEEILVKMVDDKLSINGLQVRNGSGQNWGDAWVHGASTNIQFGVQASQYGNTTILPAGKYSSFTIKCDAYAVKKSTGEKWNDATEAFTQGDYFNFEVTLQIRDYNKVLDTVGETEIQTANIALSASRGSIYEKSLDATATSVTANFNNNKINGGDRLSVGQLRTMMTTDATIELTLKDVDAPGYATIKIDEDGDNEIYQTIAKGATSATLTIPVDRLYSEDYNSLFYQIVASVNAGNAKITNATINWNDGAEAPAGTEEPAGEDEGDEPADTDEEDDADLEDGDDEDDFTDEEDEDFTDEEDDEDDFTDSDSSTDGSADNSEANANDDANVGGAGSTTDGGSNPKTGVAVAVIPAIVAAAAVVIARKRK